MKKVSVIVTAGGIGKRMGGDLPKQFLLLTNEPILMLTLRNIYQFDPSCEIILALPEDWKTYWESLVEQFSFSIPHRIVTGGTERFHTVKNALVHCNHELVAIHDAVRPFVNSQLLQDLWIEGTNGNCAIPVVAVKDSLRKVKEGNSQTVDRSHYKLVQTPQIFPKEVLQKAYQQEFKNTFTDDASVVEALGHHITLVDGFVENIKITTPLDLLLARSIYNLQQ